MPRARIPAFRLVAGYDDAGANTIVIARSAAGAMTEWADWSSLRPQVISFAGIELEW